MEKFEKLSSYLVSLISALLGYQYYDTIAEHQLLKVWFYVSIFLTACMILIDVLCINHNEKNIKSFLRGIRYACIVSFIGCFIVGVLFRIEDNKIKITGETYSTSGSSVEESEIGTLDSSAVGNDLPDSTVSFEDISTISSASTDETVSDELGIIDDDSELELDGLLGGSEGFLTLSNGEWYYRISSEYGFMATISNNSQRSIEVKVKDAVSLELIEFIPYDLLDINNESMGGDIGLYPIVFDFDMDTSTDFQKMVSVTENGEAVSEDVYYIVEPNEIRNLSMRVSFQDEGLYRFRFSINYYKNGAKYSYQFPESSCIFKK